MAELYRHYDADGNLLYVGLSYSAVLRTFQHARRTRSAAWFKKIVLIKIERFKTRKAAQIAETQAIREERPLYNIAVRGPYPPLSQEHKDKIAAAMRGRTEWTEERRRKVSVGSRLGKERAKALRELQESRS